MPDINPENYAVWARQVATSFLKDSISLNDGIAKIATENDLNPTQIKRVCEAANLSTHHSLLGTNKSKCLDFEIAEPEKVASSIEILTVDVPITDYLVPPSFPKTASDRQINQIFDIESISNVPEIEEKIKIGTRLAKKIDAAIVEMKHRQHTFNMEKSASRMRLFGMAKQMIMGGIEFQKIAKAIDIASKEKMRGEIAVIYNGLRRNGVLGVREKIAADEAQTGTKGFTGTEKPGASDISLIEHMLEGGTKGKVGNTPVIVDSSHPLIQEVNTLGDKIDEADKNWKAQWLLNDKSNLIRGKVQDLRGSIQRDSFVKNELGENMKQVTQFFAPEDNRKPGKMALSPK